MSKATQTKPKKSGKRGSKTFRLSPAIAQALLQDAVLDAQADLGPLAESVDPDMTPAAVAADTARFEEGAPLDGVPYLGTTRRAALGEAGIRTLADLRAASVEQIAAIKGIGMGNARKIKDWLATLPGPQPDGSTMPPPTPAPAPAPEVRASPDPELAAQNQAVVDLLTEMSESVTRLEAANAGAPLSGKLQRQLDRAQNVMSELAEGPDTLTPKQLRQALKSVGRITRLVSQAAELGKLSEKKQALLADAVQDRRKRLQEILGD